MYVVCMACVRNATARSLFFYVYIRDLERERDKNTWKGGVGKRIGSVVCASTTSTVEPRSLHATKLKTRASIEVSAMNEVFVQ